MTINEIKDYINNHEFYNMEDLCDELGGNIDTNYIENLDSDKMICYPVIQGERINYQNK